MNMEKPPTEKKSSFELPEGLEFKAGDKVRWKEQPEKEYTIMGFVGSQGVVRMFDAQGQPLDVAPEDLKEFELVPETPQEPEGHALEGLVE